METTSKKPKRKKGTVVSNKMEKTVVVRVEKLVAHPIYGKTITRAQKLYAHCDGELPEIGALVTVEETRPLSKLKRWRVVAA